MEIRLGNYLDKRNSATVIVCKADTLDVVEVIAFFEKIRLMLQYAGV